MAPTFHSDTHMTKMMRTPMKAAMSDAAVPNGGLNKAVMTVHDVLPFQPSSAVSVVACGQTTCFSPAMRQ